MKKNAMLKIAAVLLVAVLLTTCFISSTFAKYTAGSKTVGTNQARVAKWGLTITGTENADLQLFQKNYTDAIASSSDNDFIVAPGTSGEVETGITIQGVPEVSYKVTLTPVVTLSNNWKVDDTFVCPVKFHVNDGPAITITSAEATELENEIAKAIFGDSYPAANAGVYEKTFNPNEGFASATTVDISWEWAFEATGNQDAINAQDAIDTALGNAAVNGDLTISISYTLAAEQTNSVN